MCFNYLSYFYYFKTDSEKIEVVEGKIEKLTRNNWEFDRIAEEQIKIKDIIFTYRMNDQLFYPGYHAELPDSVLYKGKYVIIKYIVQGNDKRILSIEEK